MSCPIPTPKIKRKKDGVYTRQYCIKEEGCSEPKKVCETYTITNGAVTAQSFNVDGADIATLPIGAIMVDCPAAASTTPSSCTNPAFVDACPDGDLIAALNEIRDAVIAIPPVNLQPIIDVLNTQLTQLQAINANTDTVETKITTLITLATAGNVSTAQIATTLTNDILPALQAINADTTAIKNELATVSTTLTTVASTLASILAERDVHQVSLPVSYICVTDGAVSTSWMVRSYRQWDAEATAFIGAENVEYSQDGAAWSSTVPTGTVKVGVCVVEPTPVDLTGITALLQSQLDKLTEIDANTDTVESSLTTLINSVNSGNATVSDISTAIAASIIPSLQAIDADTSAIITELQSANTTLSSLLSTQDKELSLTAPITICVAGTSYLVRQRLVYDSESATEVSLVNEYSSDGQVWSSDAPVGVATLGSCMPVDCNNEPTNRVFDNCLNEKVSAVTTECEILPASAEITNIIRQNAEWLALSGDNWVVNQGSTTNFAVYNGTGGDPLFVYSAPPLAQDILANSGKYVVLKTGTPYEISIIIDSGATIALPLSLSSGGYSYYAINTDVYTGSTLDIQIVCPAGFLNLLEDLFIAEVVVTAGQADKSIRAHLDACTLNALQLQTDSIVDAVTNAATAQSIATHVPIATTSGLYNGAAGAKAYSIILVENGVINGIARPAGYYVSFEFRDSGYAPYTVSGTLFYIDEVR